MRVFEVQTSSSSPRLPLCQIAFLVQPPLLSPWRKNCVLSLNQSINQSITYPAYLMPQGPKLALWNFDIFE